MSVTLNSIISNLNTYISDSSTDRISDVERFEAITEATAWLLEELGNEHMIETYELNYVDTINYYKVTTSIPDLLTGADLRRDKDNYYSFIRKSPRELSEEIAQKNTEPSWAIERRDGDTYLVVNATPRNTASTISSFDSLTDGGTWVADTATSDALNLTADTIEFRQGSGSLNFDVDVSQSGNNRATIYNQSVANGNLTQHEDLGSFYVDVYIPDATEISSVSLIWGSDTAATPATKSNYYTSTTTTDIDGENFNNGWNTLRFNWGTATETGTVDSSTIKYIEITVNYSGSQSDDTDFRVDNLRIANPEKLILHYITWYVGTVSGSDLTPITAFTATTNVPFFSGQYDNYKYVVAHYAAGLLFGSPLRLRDEAKEEFKLAEEALDRYRKNFESSKTREVKSFKLAHNLRRRNKTGRIR